MHICSGYFIQVSEPWPVGLLFFVLHEIEWCGQRWNFSQNVRKRTFWCAHKEYSNQRVHVRNLIKVFAWRNFTSLAIIWAQLFAVDKCREMLVLTTFWGIIASDKFFFSSESTYDLLITPQKTYSITSMARTWMARLLWMIQTLFSVPTILPLAQ